MCACVLARTTAIKTDKDRIKKDKSTIAKDRRKRVCVCAHVLERGRERWWWDRILSILPSLQS